MATVTTFITESLALYPVQPSPSQISLALLKANVEPDAELTADNGLVPLAYTLWFLLPFLPDKVSEGGYSAEWNKTVVSAWIGQLFQLAGQPNPLAVTAPKVSDASFLW